jgi:hypothetical protein
MRRPAIVVLALLAFPSLPAAQVPQPFPRPQNPARPAPAAPQPPSPAQATPPPSPAALPAPAAEARPTEASLGFPIYPNAEFITSYDAGRGQRYYLFGSEVEFASLVKYYQQVLKTKGILVFDAPGTHIFEMGKFEEKTMAFPPGVTIKDYTWNGGAGYLNPQKGGKPERFPSIIQIVPAQAGAKP